MTIPVFRQRANGSPEQALFRAKQPSSRRVQPNQSGAPPRPQVSLMVLEQCQDGLAQRRRSGCRFESSADQAKQAGIGSGPKISLPVLEERGDVQAGQPLSGPELGHLLTQIGRAS